MSDFDSDPKTTEIRTTYGPGGSTTTEVRRNVGSNRTAWWVIGLVAVVAIAATAFVVTRPSGPDTNSQAIAAATAQGASQAAAQDAQSAAALAQSNAQSATQAAQISAQTSAAQAAADRSAAASSADSAAASATTSSQGTAAAPAGAAPQSNDPPQG
jgi:hypothetical protein